MQPFSSCIIGGPHCHSFCRLASEHTCEGITVGEDALAEAITALQTPEIFVPFKHCKPSSHQVEHERNLKYKQNPEWVAKRKKYWANYHQTKGKAVRKARKVVKAHDAIKAAKLDESCPEAS